jgi:hypothetical protein
MNRSLVLILVTWAHAALAQGDAPERLVTASGMRVREAPSTDAPVVERVALGRVLRCLEQQGDFCRTELPEGKVGWFFAPLTEPLAQDAEAQLQRLTDRRFAELAEAGEDRRADLFDFHRFLLRRVEQAQTPLGKARARLDELRLVRLHPQVFHGDPRIYRDEAQGHRMKREALWKLVDELRPTAPEVAEQAAFLAVEHGHDFECEGFIGCMAGWWKRVECEYLERFPDGAHANQVLERLRRDAEWMAKEAGAGGEVEPLDKALAAARACVSRSRASGVKPTLKALEALGKVSTGR